MLETLERLILDPISEQPPYQVAANRPLEVTATRTPSPEGHGIFLVDHQYPRPDMTSTFATSRDSQGEARFGKPKLSNRKIPIKVYITEAQGVGAATNLVTNPAGELLKKFTDGADYPVTRELSGTNGIPCLAGEFRDKHAYDGSSSSAVMGTFPLTFPAAGTYTVSIFVWIPSNWDGQAPRLQSGGSYAGSSEENIGIADLAKRDQWQRISTKITIAGGDLVGTWQLSCKVNPTSAGTGVLYTDAIQAESGSAPSAFLFGDTPGCTWNGSPHASTSTRFGSGSDRKRFIRSMYDLQEKVEKLADEGGTFKRVLPDGSWMVFDVVEATFVGNWEKRFNQGQEEFSFELVCKPGARLQPITFTAHEEKTLPILKFTELAVPGNMPALGDLLIEDIQGVNRNFVAVSLASRYLDQSATGDVFYEAETRKRLTSATLAAGSGVPSGSEANKVVSCPLFEEFTPYLSTNSSAGAFASHVGAQKLFARVWQPATNTGISSVRFEYAQGDLLRWRSLDAVNLSSGLLGKWVIVDLGVVRLNQATLGTQRWEGRLNAKSTVAGDVLHIDWIAVLPVEEFFGEAKALTIPSSIVGPQIARDAFNQTSGNLAGKTATFGGNWSGFGDSDDFKVTGIGNNHKLYREPSSNDVSSANNGPVGLYGYGAVTGRYARLGTGVLAGGSVSFDFNAPNSFTSNERKGVIARYVDEKNMVMAALSRVLVGGEWRWELTVHVKFEGTWSLAYGTNSIVLVAGAYVTLTVYIDATGVGNYVLLEQGDFTVYFSEFGGFEPLISRLKAGGKLASGGYGAYHSVEAIEGSGYFPPSGYFDNFSVREATVPAIDAAIYANRDFRLRWDKTLREASDGSGALSDVGQYEGDRLLIPPSGREGRPARLAILASRALPGAGEDVQADDLKATLTITPRVIEVPEAA